MIEDRIISKRSLDLERALIPKNVFVPNDFVRNAAGMRSADQKVIGCIVCAIAAIITYWFATKSSSPTGLPKLPATQSGKFKDGDGIELIEVRRGNVIRSATARGEVIQANSSVSARYVFWPLIEIVRKSDKIHNQLIEYQVVFETPDPLVLEFRWSGSSGELRRPHKVSTGFDLLDFPDSYHTTSTFKGFESSSEMIAASNPLPNAPEIIVQIPDGKGGWVTGSGPVWVEGDPYASCFVVFPSWIRSERNLKFRFVRCGNPPLEFTVPNPDVRPLKPFSVPPGAEPARFSHPEFEVDLIGVTERQHTEQFPLLRPDFEFRKAHGSEWCWQWTSRSVEDEYGNNASTSLIFYPLPDVGTLVRFHGFAEPTEWHPREFSECLPVCEGTIGPDGTVIPNTPISGNAARVIAVTSRPLSMPDTETVLRFSAPRDLPWENIVQAPGDASVPQIGFEIELEGKCAAAEFSALESRLGKSSDWKVVIFRNGEAQSCNATFFKEWTSSTSIGGQTTYHLKVSSVARCHTGDPVKVCLARKKDAVPVSLVFPRSQVKRVVDE